MNLILTKHRSTQAWAKVAKQMFIYINRRVLMKMEADKRLPPELHWLTIDKDEDKELAVEEASLPEHPTNDIQTNDEDVEAEEVIDARTTDATPRSSDFLNIVMP